MAKKKGKKKVSKKTTKRRRKPPPKTKGVAKRPAGMASSDMDTGIEGPVPDLNSRGYLRFAAGNYYATNVNGISVRAMSEQEPFSRVPLRQLHEWSTMDHWGQRRKEFAELVKVKLAERIADQIVDDRLDTLKELSDQFDTMKGMIAGTPPKTYEGMVTGWVKLGQFIDTMRQNVLHVKAASADSEGGGVGSTASPIKPVITAVEARAAAEAIMVARQKEVRARIAEGDPNGKPVG